MYIDLLTKLKNAQKARKEFLKVPYSNMDMVILELLAKNNFIDSVAKKGRLPKRVIEIKLKYDSGEGLIRGVKFLSKPSRRLYSGFNELRSVHQGYGMGFVSTPKGILTFKEARKEKVGGEMLFEIW